MLKADLHVHTCYSMDCSTPLDEIIAQCLKTGINCLAVSDHGVIEGALKLKEMAPFKVIVAEEILTPVGELMGLFLTERIPGGLSVAETITRIRKQGGLVSIPHPFGRPHLPGPRELVSAETVSQVDIIEVFNARTPLPGSSRKASRLALKYGRATSAGSDAHIASEIGRAYVEMPDFHGPDDFLDCLRKGKIFGSKSSIAVHFASALLKVNKHLQGD